LATFYEFFAGGGMARAGLGPGWTCLFANDFDARKAASYAENWGGDGLLVGDVATVTTADLPARADLAWASFPCQDLSLAGAGAGLSGARSGSFWPFRDLMRTLGAEGRAPRLIVLENVAGALTSSGGRDFAAIGAALSDAGYRFGALVIDAARFVPQSRPRLFIVAAHASTRIPEALTGPTPDQVWPSAALGAAHDGLPEAARAAWVWWRLPAPPPRNAVFSDLIEASPQGVAWRSPAETRRLLDLMSPVNLAKVEAAARAGRRMIGAVYRRTRPDGAGGRLQRAEVRFDDVAGCLRTPAGGSSRQVVLIVDGAEIRSRLLSPREAARLMGLQDDYRLPANANEAYHLVGDGVVAPVVRFLAAHILEPILAASGPAGRIAA
jgi:DNA (cytosine-5)-methyltransferase 1